MKFILVVLVLVPSIILAQNRTSLSVNERLLLACKSQDHKNVRQLIGEGADVNYIKKTELPLSPLLVSVLMGDSLGVSILLKSGANAAILDNAPLASACMFGYLAVIRQLINGGASFDGEASDALHNLLLKAPKDFKWLFLSEIATENELANITFPDLDNENALIQYSLSTDDKNYLECIDVLVDNNFPKNRLNDEGLTALDVAIGRKNIPLIQKLIGLNFPSVTNSFDTIDLAILAASQNNKEILVLSLQQQPDLLNKKNERGNYLITESFRSRSIETTDLLLSKHVDLGVLDNEGNSALYYVASWGNSKYYSLLIPKLSSLVNRKNADGVTPFYQAALFGRTELFNLMLDSVNLSGPSFELFIHDLINHNHEENRDELDKGQLEIIRLLVQKNVALNGLARNQTALERCVVELVPRGDNLKLVKLLVDKSNDTSELNRLLIHFVDRYEDDFIQHLVKKKIDLNELMKLAIRKSRPELVTWLLNIEDLPSKRDVTYPEALETAVLEGNDRLCAILLQAGMSASHKNSLGYTPLDYAVNNNDFQLCLLLIEYGASLDEATMNPGVIDHMKASQMANIQKLLGVMLLKNQLIAEKPTGSINCLGTAVISKELEQFEQNLSTRLPKHRVSIDQEPRFWEWFPYEGTGNGEKRNKLGSISHGQHGWRGDGAARRENLNVYISDLGHLPTFNFGRWGETSNPTKLKTVLKASTIIPFCSYDPNSPLSYPAVKISNSSGYSNQVLSVHQKSDSARIILPGHFQLFDRSEGELKVIYDATSSGKIEIDFEVEYNIGTAITISENTSLSDRLQTYSNLNNARLKLNSAELSRSEIQSTKTYTYVLSLKALQKKYHRVSELELTKLIDEVNKIEQNISELYSRVFETNTLSDRANILSLVGLIINEGNLTISELTAFKHFKDKVNASTTELELSSVISQFLKQEVFVQIENKVFEIQLLMLEAAQYLCIEDLEHKLAYVKKNLRNKKVINPAKFLINPSDLQGRGISIINALKD